VTGDDYERLGDHAATLVDFIENRAFMKIEDGHCSALVIDREARTFLCKIYEQRPTICRELERGSPQCEGELALKRERPLIALRRQSEGEAKR